jgi:two-component system, chemotaxis family, chemotaxis protein CheY
MCDILSLLCFAISCQQSAIKTRSRVPNQQAVMSAVFQNVKVLIVDHNEGMRNIIATVLRGLGFPSLQSAENGEDALNRIRIYGPDLVISELKMPVMDGPTLVRTLRGDQNSPSNSVPIIITSGHTEDKYVRECLVAGADHFLARPISGRNLADRIGRIIRDERQFVRTPHYIGPARNLKIVDIMKANKPAVAA